jgi:hypothetical protein
MMGHAYLGDTGSLSLGKVDSRQGLGLQVRRTGHRQLLWSAFGIVEPVWNTYSHPDQTWRHRRKVADSSPEATSH